MTDDLELIRRLVDGEWSAADLVAHVAENPRPKLSRPRLRTYEEIEGDPDRMPLSESVSALYSARYAGKVTDEDFWTAYGALWPGVGATS
ncbi:hypothetical protein [Williamsia sp.]|uniref:hypothetical protein n=1 Tax=Williamsia sp. TaxID=1872085 RepID=UPI001A231369|nr:hypothetical protein [Williamsia sp.]MBJ7289406.1 hypothetical protein [Williamsia sp.]